MVIVSLKNIKTNQLKRKQNNNWDKPQPILTIYRGAVIVDLLNYIYINKSFYTLKVRLQFPEEIPSQAYINKKNIVISQAEQLKGIIRAILQISGNLRKSLIYIINKWINMA